MLKEQIETQIKKNYENHLKETRTGLLKCFGKNIEIIGTFQPDDDYLDLLDGKKYREIFEDKKDRFIFNKQLEYFFNKI